METCQRNLELLERAVVKYPYLKKIILKENDFPLEIVVFSFDVTILQKRLLEYEKGNRRKLIEKTVYVFLRDGKITPINVSRLDEIYWFEIVKNVLGKRWIEKTEHLVFYIRGAGDSHQANALFVVAKMPVEKEGQRVFNELPL